MTGNREGRLRAQGRVGIYFFYYISLVVSLGDGLSESLSYHVLHLWDGRVEEKEESTRSCEHSCGWEDGRAS